MVRKLDPHLNYNFTWLKVTKQNRINFDENWINMHIMKNILKKKGENEI